MPVLALGTWQLTNNTAEAVAFALGKGYTMIDTSGDYGTQPGIAEGIKKSGLKRDDFYIVTKVEETDDAYRAVHKNLGELQLDYADLILIHRPPKQGAGEELWQGLIRARDEGLTRDIGVSNYSAELIQTLIEASGEVPVVNQIEWSPFGHSDAMLSYARENHITIQAYSPLTRTKRLNDDILVGIANKYGKSPAQVLIRWNVQLGTVPLPKANRQEHQIENIDVFDFKLTDDDMITLSHLNERYSSLGSLPYK
jgi:2,5-diketo-D-gluconate reductase A